MGHFSRKGERLRQRRIVNLEYLVGYYMEGEQIAAHRPTSALSIPIPRPPFPSPPSDSVGLGCGQECASLSGSW